MWSNFPLLPDQASTLAGEVDTLFLTLIGITAFFSTLIFLGILFFSIYYRRRPGRIQPVSADTILFLELLWTAVPICIAVLLFIWGANLFMRGRQPPADALTVYIVGKQWMWKVQHPEGRREIDELHIPVRRPVRLVMASQDVI